MRELFAVLALADIPEAATLRAQLGSVAVHADGLDCRLAASPDAPRFDERRSFAAVEAEGVDADGRRLLVRLLAEDGYLTRLEVEPLLGLEIRAPLPQSLVQLDSVPRGTLALHWLIPRPLTILEAAAQHGVH